MQQLRGKVAVVTGGASGIGFALAERAAREEMLLVVADVEPGALDEAVARLKAMGAEVEGVRTDVTDPVQVQSLADATVERFGGVHLVCNNAGVATGGVSGEMPVESWEWVLGVNMWGVVHVIRTFVPLLIAQPEGHIVNTASVAGLVAAPFMGPYNASKHAAVAISETLHHELAMMAPHVKVSTLCPGWVNTRIFESSRNRPAHLQTPSEGEAAGAAALMQAVLDNAMEPAAVADKTFAAVKAEQFWVLTHDDENDFWVDAVARRLDSVATRTNPQLGFPV
jgi:NAD(P)-dependent dehydrogenase (short-subunit alcohol dehydrogenase family)